MMPDMVPGCTWSNAAISLAGMPGWRPTTSRVMRCGTVSPIAACIRLDRLCSSWSTAQMSRMTCRAGPSAGSPLVACALRRGSGDAGPAGRRSRTVGVLLVFLAAAIVHPDQRDKDDHQGQGGEHGN